MSTTRQRVGLEHDQREQDDVVRFVRAAGWSGLAAVAILVVSDFAILQAFTQPDPTATAVEITDWVSDNSGRLRAANGIQIAYLPLLGVFFVGVYSTLSPRHQSTWPTVGLVGAVISVTVATIASATGGVLFWRADLLANEPQLASALWGINHAALLALAVPYALMFTGFGIAGRQSGLVPAWVAVVGYASAACGLISVLFLAETLDAGWSEPFEFLTFLLALVWLASMAVLLIRHAKPA